MNTLLILSVAIGVVAADVSSLGYQYNVPQTSYGIPSHQISASSSNYNTRYTTAGSGGSGFGYKGVGGQGVVSYPSGSVGTVYQTTGGSGFQSGGGSLGFGSGYQSLGAGSGYQGSAYQSSGSFGSFGGNSGGSAGSLNLGNSLAHTFQGQSAQKYQQQIQFQSQPAQVFKHFYVHAAPEEPEVVKPRGPVVLPPAQKHYKIIFIKTPSAAAAGAQIAPVVPQTEEKTIVYVLVKKPEAQADLVVPKIEQKPPSKPEVYFIKYKNKDESQAVINNIVSDYNKGQQTVSVSGVGVDGGAGAGGFSGASGSSGFSSSGFSGDSAGFSGLSGLSGGSNGAGISVVTDTGSFGGQYDSGSAGSSIGSFVTNTESVGAGGLTFAQGNGNQGASFGSTGGYSQGAGFSQGSGYSQESYSSGGGVGGVTISKSEPLSQAVTTGYDSSDSGSVGLVSGTVGLSHGVVGSSSTASYDVTSLSSSQGVPHETYGIPTFKTL